jgi:phosphatidylglycerophosphate synthase
VPVAPAPSRALLGVGGCAALGVLALLALLTGVAVTVGLSGAAWAAGLSSGVVLTAAMSRGLQRADRPSAGPADLVTLSRGILACGVAALTVDSLLGRDLTQAVVTLAVPALVSDAVDGWVARHSGAVTAFGGRFDGEVDAFLILVLSVYVAPSVGWWVLAAGVARYAFGAAAWAVPWMRGQLDYRYWRKVVTATVSIVLTVAAAELVPRWATVGAVVVALTLLTESFGRDVWRLWRSRSEAESEPHGGSVHQPHTGTVGNPRPAKATVTNVLALLLVWFALLAPDQPIRFSPFTFLRLPAEALVLGGLVLVLPARWVRPLGIACGSVLGALTVLKVLDLGTFMVLDRPFNVVTDRSLLGSGVAFVGDSWGAWAAAASVVGAVGIAGATLAAVALAVGGPAAPSRASACSGSPARSPVSRSRRGSRSPQRTRRGWEPPRSAPRSPRCATRRTSTVTSRPMRSAIPPTVT